MKGSSIQNIFVEQKKSYAIGYRLSGPAIRVLIADTQPIFRKGLQKILSYSKDITVVNEINDLPDLLGTIKENSIDVLILDNNMMGNVDLRLLQEIKIIKPDLPVLILSTHREKKYAVRAIKMGAAGYLTKDSAPSAIIDAIRRVSAGGKYISETLAELLAREIDRYSNKLPHERLSERESQVMLLLAAGDSVKEIAVSLNISVKTVSTYRSRILEKMSMKRNIDLTFYAMEYRLIE